MAVATLVHLVLSLVYAAVLAKVIRNLSLAASLFVGGAFGLILYGVNLYAFTAIFRGSFRFVARSHSWPIWYSGSRQRRPTAAPAPGRAPIDGSCAGHSHQTLE